MTGGNLLLLEHYPVKDGPWKMASGATILVVLSKMIEKDCLGTSPKDMRSFVGRTANDLLDADRDPSPLLMFEKLGAIIGPEKMIDVVYRIRMTFVEQFGNWTTTTIGYPISICRG